MSNNTTLPGTGDIIRTIDRTAYKTQVVTLDLGGSGAESLVTGSIPVTGAFYPTTQPVSGTVGISGTVPVSGAFYQATQPVSGTFWQATQPVSIASMPSTPVTGTFWPATQPVSGSVSVSNLPATQAVTGTFWQATQPISGSVSVSNFPASQAVTGTFWQATQPVSLASAPLPTGASTDASLTGHAQTFKAITAVSVVSTANAAVTATLPLTAGQFHYITRIRIVNINPTITAIAAAASALSYTTTNLPGSLAWTAGTLLAAGAEKVVVDEVLSQPLKASVAGTATTVVAPAIGTGGLCRITVYYYVAA